MGIKFVVLGDIHAPFHHKKALSWALDFIKEHQPKVVLSIGDIFDFYALSRFPKSANLVGYTPADEVGDARSVLSEMWRIIQLYSPKSQCVQLLGNHDSRLKSRVLEKLPEIFGIVNFEQLFQFKGVKTYHDERQEVVLSKIAFMHGYRSKLGDHARHNFMNTVVGHTHRGGLWFGPDFWELNVGYLANPASAALSYTKQRWTNWTLGLGVIDEHGPRFLPYKGK